MRGGVQGEQGRGVPRDPLERVEADGGIAVVHDRQDGAHRLGKGQTLGTPLLPKA